MIVETITCTSEGRSIAILLWIAIEVTLCIVATLVIQQRLLKLAEHTRRSGESELVLVVCQLDLVHDVQVATLERWLRAAALLLRLKNWLVHNLLSLIFS